MLDDYARARAALPAHRPAGRRRAAARWWSTPPTAWARLYAPLLERPASSSISLYFELDGTFPNHEANPLKLENLRDLCAAVRETGADLGVAFDGDADRAAFVDERGEPVGSDIDDRAHRRRNCSIASRARGGLRPALVARGRRAHSRRTAAIPVRERVGPLLHQGDAARARAASSAASSPATTTSATTTTPTARCSRCSRSSTCCARPARAMSRAVGGAAAALRQDARDQLRGRGQGRRDRASWRERYADGRDRLPRRHHGAVPGLVVQRASVEHRAAAAAGAEADTRRAAGGEDRRIWSAFLGEPV